MASLPKAAGTPSIRDTPPTSKTYTYPYASSPDIIRSHQKDAHQTFVLQSQLTSILRQIYGSRFTHTHDSTIHAFTELLYLGLTTLLGNRTLGEEYCDIHQVETVGGKLPAVGKRAGYILSAVLVPYGLARALPKFRAILKTRLESSLEATEKGTTAHKVQCYIRDNVATLTAMAPVYALSLGIFYFSGTYYHLSKRVVGLRYIFSRKMAPSEQREGYEVLGVLLVLQMAVQAYMHVQSAIASSKETDADEGSQTREVDAPARIAMTTHTSAVPEGKARYDLADEAVMGWLAPAQQRKCTLCLETLKDPSVTTCGHMFCWTCITQWIQERAECPLCRQATLKQHVLPLRG